MFGRKQPTAKESAKQVKREVKGSQRELDRELRELDRRETQLIAEIKKEAKLGRSEKAVQILAKQLVQLRNQRDRLLGTRAHVGALASQATAMASQVAVADAVGTAGKAMGRMNQTMQKQNVGLTLQQFQRESAKMNMTEEMMGDMLSDAFDTEETEAEEFAVVDQVLAEVGIDLTKQLQDAPATSLQQQSQFIDNKKEEPPSSSSKQLDDLQAQLNAL